MEKKLCDKCGKTISSHTVGDRRLCCKCYVGEDNPPAEWHRGCMEAYNQSKYGVELTSHQLEYVRQSQAILEP